MDRNRDDTMTVNNYATAAEIAALLPNLDLNGYAQDGVTLYTTILTTLAGRASRAFDKWTNRKPGAYYVDADTTRYYGGPIERSILFGIDTNDNRLGVGIDGGHVLDVDELAAAPTSIGISTTGSVTTYDVTLATTDYLLYPFNAAEDGYPYTQIVLDLLNGTVHTWYGFPRGIKIVGKFGYATATPDDIKQAVITLAARWLKRGQNAYQDRVSILDQATALTYLNKQDSDVVEALWNYRRLPI
jgi:hypothetical protein